MAMKQQLVRMVHMMNKLNKVLEFRRTRDSTDTLNINDPPRVAMATRVGGVRRGIALKPLDGVSV